MKKLLLFILTISVSFCLGACEKKPVEVQSTDSNPISQTEKEKPISQTENEEPQSYNNDLYQKTDLEGSWTDTISGETLDFEGGSVRLKGYNKDGNKISRSFSSYSLENDVITIDGSDFFLSLKIKEDSNSLKLIGNDCEYIPTERYNSQALTVSIGDTVKTDIANIAVNSFVFSENVSDNLDPNGSGITSGETDQILACFEFTLTNNGKETKDLNKLCQFSVEYKDGYIFGDKENLTGAYAEKGNNNGIRIYKSNSSTGISLKLSALNTTTYRGCIKCPSKVSTDTQSPLILNVRLISSEGFELFKYEIQ